MKDINEFYNKALVMLRSNFNLTSTESRKITNRYINAVRVELNTSVDFNSLTDHYLVRLKVINNNSKATIDKERQYIHTWFMNNCPLFKIISLGSNIDKKFTEISMYYKVDTIIDSLYTKVENNENIYLEDTIEALYGKELAPIIFEADEDTIDIALINCDSLKSYINVTNNYILKNKKNLMDTNTLETRVREAKRIYTLANVCDGHLLQIKSQSEYGRLFYKGPNLQSCHKDIRHAALGKCIEYDINNAVYAWRLHEAKTITKEYNTNMEFPCTIDYMDRKDALRSHLVEDVYGISSINDKFKLKLIKQAFTAIGFGAKGSGGPVFWYEDGVRKTYAINDIIRNPYERDTFLEHPFVREFIEEQHSISKIIFSKYNNDYKNVAVVKTESGQMSESKLLAYLYQHVETALMNNALSHIPKADLLLRCHDAFYVRRISKDDILEVRYKLQQYIPGLALAKTEIDEWVTVDPRFVQSIDVDLAKHRHTIAQEMLKSKNYKLEHKNNVIPIKPASTDNSKYMKIRNDEIKRLEEEIRQQEIGKQRLSQLLAERNIEL